jgi:hypothetical protein
MKTYVHARLGKEEQAILEELRTSTGQSDSELVRHGLKLVLKEVSRKHSALAVAGRSVGKFKNGPKDLATNKKYLTGFGE